MNIAAITITYNDEFKFNEWCDHYEKYKEELYLHIIIDNNSTDGYLKKVKKYFNNSVIIEMGYNGGCTASYNAGIKYALADENVDAIALIGNDMMFDKRNMTKLYDFLFNNNKFGMVEPLILNSNGTINDFGCEISNYLTLKPYMSGKKITDINEQFNICSTVTGGMNLAKREFYEEVGFQDENLFMYSDEVDMGIRAKKKGLLMAATKESIAWHMHINPNIETNRRHPFSRYLIARNKTYLARKHYGARKCLNVALFFIIKAMVSILILFIKGNFSKIKDEWWQILGAINGFNGNMKQNKYSHQ